MDVITNTQVYRSSPSKHSISYEDFPSTKRAKRTHTNTPAVTISSKQSKKYRSVYGIPSDLPNSVVSTGFDESRLSALPFSLVKTDGLPRNPTREEFQVLHDTLPPHTDIGISGPFLIMYVDDLPPKPWPVSVAGLPLFIKTADLGVPWKIGSLGRVHHRVLEDLDARKKVSRELFNSVINYFETKDLEILEVLWMWGSWRITIEDTIDPSVLPGSICQVSAFYIRKLPMTNAAFCGHVPSKGGANTTTYTTIRPGVLVASHALSTTSGVLVQNEDNETFMTVSAHGFPIRDTAVYHPSLNGSIIGEVCRRIGDTDIALAKLEENIMFENITFQSDVEPTGVRFRGIKDVFKMRSFDSLSMENPFVGLIDGQFMTISKTRIFNGQNTSWIEQSWNWFGQDPDRLPIDGCCGSAIWDKDNEVVCFFHLYSDEGCFGIGPCAQTLIDEGFNLSHT